MVRASLRRLMNTTYSYKLLAPGYRIRMRNVIGALRVRPGDRILEVGSGKGEYSRIIAALGGRVISMDIEKKDVLSASAGCSDVLYLIADAQNMPFSDESFDKVFSTEVIEHIPDDDMAVREMRRVQKPDGYTVAEIPQTPSFRDPINTVLRKFGRKPLSFLSDYAWKHERFYTSRDAADLFRRNGYALRECRQIINPFVMLIHMYLPELFTFHILPKTAKKRDAAEPSPLKMYAFRAGYMLSDVLGSIDKRIGGGSHGGTLLVAGK